MLASFVDVTQEALKAGDTVQLHGLGTFETVQRAACTRRIPRTGEKVEVPVSTSAKFKIARTLKDMVKAAN